MDLSVAIFVALNGLALLLLPRRLAALPLLMAACYVPRTQMLQLGVATFTAVRVLVAVGLVRLAVRREWVRGGVNGLDALMAAWGVWMVASVAFHPAPHTTFVLRVRDLYEAWGLYLLFRVFCQSREDIQSVARILAVVLAPLAAAMLMEKWAGMNLFAGLDGSAASTVVRNGVVRAHGPFAHPILAGTVGAVCLPVVAGLWRHTRGLAVVGVGACAGIVVASGSSGPIMSLGAGLGGLLLWRLRDRMRLLRWTALLAYLALDVVTKRPAYFVLFDFDLMGGSTGWHRAQLIRSAFAHLGEWWLVGTDYTRHWMASGLAATDTQADITNHYLAMGVDGGLLLTLLFIAALAKGFSNVGRAVRSESDRRKAFVCWTVGASLFAHAVTCLSVSYFDHTVLFLYLTLALTAAAVPGFAADATTAAVAIPGATQAWLRFQGVRWSPSCGNGEFARPVGLPRSQRSVGTR